MPRVTLCVMKLYVLAELIETYGATLAQAVPSTRGAASRHAGHPSHAPAQPDRRRGYRAMIRRASQMSSIIPTRKPATAFSRPAAFSRWNVLLDEPPSGP
jgi:hypothetical protein